MTGNCPLCMAKPGQPCRTPSGQRTFFGRPHQARVTRRISAHDWPYWLAHRQPRP